MKKKKAAKMLSPNERALRERVLRRYHARCVAIQIRCAWDWLDRAIEAGEGSDAERFCIEQVKGSWFMAGNLMNFGSPAMMHSVADALEGKLLLSKKDEEKLKAYEKAMRTGKRCAERSMSLAPFPSEIWDALTSLSGASTVSTKRKDTTPLTPNEKQMIRKNEPLYKHEYVEDLIGKSYKRTDSGDYVTVNENGGALIAKRTVKPKKSNKEALSRRLKKLGCILSETPGAPRKRPLKPN